MLKAIIVFKRLLSSSKKIELTTIKAHTPLLHQNTLKIQQILSIMRLPHTSNVSYSEGVKIFMDHIIEKANINSYIKQQFIVLNDNQEKFGLIEMCLDEFVNYQQFGIYQQKFIDSFFIFWAKIFKQTLLQNFRILNKKSFLNYIKKFTKYYLLTSRDKQITMLLLDNIFRFQVLFSQPITVIYKNTIRNCVQDLFRFDFQQKEITLIFYIFGKIGIHSIYHGKANQIILHLNKKLDDNWLFQKKVLTTFVKTLGKLGLYSQKFLKNIKKMLLQDNYLKLAALSYLVNLKIITKQNVKIYEQDLKNILRKVQKRIVFATLARLFYRAGIWLDFFWIQAFQLIAKQYERCGFTKFDIFAIKTIIQVYKDQISPLIINSSAILFQKLRYKGISFENFDVKQDYHQNYGKKNNTSNQMQFLLTNSLRVKNKIQIKSQAQGKYQQIQFPYFWLICQSTTNSLFKQIIKVILSLTLIQVSKNSIQNHNLEIIYQRKQVIKSFLLTLASINKETFNLSNKLILQFLKISEMIQFEFQENKSQFKTNQNLILIILLISYVLNHITSISNIIFLQMYDWIKNKANNAIQSVSKTIYPPPETDQFEVNGQLSPDQFKRAGDKLTQVCTSWVWKPSSNPNYMSKYLDEKKQYLVLEKALCRTRISSIPVGQQEKVQGAGGQEVIVLISPQKKEEKEDLRFYTMYIIYDQHYHTPRMYFSAIAQNGTPISNEDIKDDIQKEYLHKTLTMEPFPFINGLTMPTVHPCKHAAVLKSMSDAMRENGQKVESHFALLIFLKFITSVIPTVQFDITGDLHFE